MRPIVIIEREPNLSRTIGGALRSDGFHSISIRPEQARKWMEGQALALLLIDLQAVEDPCAFCSSVDARHPIVVIGCTSDLDSCAKLIEAGADECVPRSVSDRELIARIRNVWRRAENRPVELETHSMQAMRVRIGGQFRDLSLGETEVLSILVEHAPAPLTVNRILELLRPSPKVTRATVASRLKSLRQKLGPGWIEIRPKFGYQLVRIADESEQPGGVPESREVVQKG